MSVGGGSNIIRNRMLFGYDCDDRSTLFYPGEPTDNLLPQPLFFETGYTTESWTGEIEDSVIIAPDSKRTATRIKRVSGYVYKRNTIAPTFTISVGSIITFSCWVRKLDSTDQTGNGINIWCYDGAGSGNRASASQTLYNDQWVRQTVTYTTLTDETSFSFGFIGSASSHIQGEVAIWHPQLEIKPHVTQFTPNARSTTESLLDLTSNINVNLNAITFDDSAHIVYDGVNDYIHLGVGTDFFPLPNFTLEMWIKTTGMAAGMSSGGMLGITYGIRISVTSADKVFFGVDNGVDLSGITSVADVADDKYHHIIATQNLTTSCIYIDGKLNKTGARTWSGTTRWPTDQVVVGYDRNNGAISRFYGKMPIVSIYDIEFTPEQVHNNFISKKSRFGL